MYSITQQLVIVGLVILSGIGYFSIFVWGIKNYNRILKKIKSLITKDIKAQKDSLTNSGPYRTKSDMTTLEEIDAAALEALSKIKTKEKPKIFCKDCKHFEWTLPSKNPMCRVGTVEYSPIHGLTRYATNACVRNENMNCEDFCAGPNNYNNPNHQYPDGKLVDN